MTFEEHLVQTVKDIRTQLQGMENLSSFELVIKAEGRVHEGDVEITFKLEHGYYEGTTTGNNIDAVVTEFMRRMGWKQLNMPLCLPSVEKVNE